MAVSRVVVCAIELQAFMPSFLAELCRRDLVTGNAVVSRLPGKTNDVGAG